MKPSISDEKQDDACVAQPEGELLSPKACNYSQAPSQHFLVCFHYKYQMIACQAFPMMRQIQQTTACSGIIVRCAEQTTLFDKSLFCHERHSFATGQGLCWEGWANSKRKEVDSEPGMLQLQVSDLNMQWLPSMDFQDIPDCCLEGHQPLQDNDMPWLHPENPGAPLQDILAGSCLTSLEESLDNCLNWFSDEARTLQRLPLVLVSDPEASPN